MSKQARSIITLQPVALELEDAAQFVALSSASIKRMQNAGEFPKPRQLAGRRVAYLVKELIEWVESRPVSNILPPENAQFGSAGKPA